VPSMSKLQYPECQRQSRAVAGKYLELALVGTLGMESETGHVVKSARKL
jgi:hypothetical protein